MLRKAARMAAFLFMRKLLVLPLLLLAVVACATRKAPGKRPDVTITQISGVPPSARWIEGGMSVRYLVRIRNNGLEPITLQRVNIDSVGIGAYEIDHQSVFKVRIAPEQSGEVAFWAAAQRSQNVAGANGPVTLRVVASFDSPSGRFEDVTVQNVSAGSR
jgi:hypothetical protein